MKHVLSMLVLCSVISGCDADRVAKLEKENTEIKAKLDQQSAVVQYDLQAKCAKDAKLWFNENWGGGKEKDTMLLTYTNHYNKSSNDCFIEVEYHHGDPITWFNDISIWNVYENQQNATYTEQHQVPKGLIPPSDYVMECVVAGQKCTSQDQFNSLSGHYMSD